MTDAIAWLFVHRWWILGVLLAVVFVVDVRDHCKELRDRRGLLRGYHRVMRKRMRDRLAKP